MRGGGPGFSWFVMAAGVDVPEHVRGTPVYGDLFVSRQGVWGGEAAQSVRHAWVGSEVEGESAEDEVFRSFGGDAGDGGDFPDHAAGEHVACPAAGGIPEAEHFVSDEAVCRVA